MAQQVIRRFTCDRCKKPYDESDPDSKATPKVIFALESSIVEADAKSAAPRKLSFEDLCPRCSGRVLDLMGQIALDKPDPAEKNPKPGDAPIESSSETATVSSPQAADSPPAPSADKKADKKQGQRTGGSAEPTTH